MEHLFSGWIDGMVFVTNSQYGRLAIGGGVRELDHESMKRNS